MSFVGLKVSLAENLAEPLHHHSFNHRLFSWRGICTDNDISLSTDRIANSFDKIIMPLHVILISKKIVMISSDTISITIDLILVTTNIIVLSMDFIILTVDDFIVGAINEVGLNELLTVSQEESGQGKEGEFFEHEVLVSFVC